MKLERTRLHPSTRLALTAGAAVPILYFGAQALAAPFFPNFSFFVNTASQLGSDLSSQPNILNGGAALTGVAALLASYGLYRALRAQRVWLIVSVLVAVCSISMGLASLWAATHPLPNPRHNAGMVGAGIFATPFVVLLASFALPDAVRLRWYLAANVCLFVLVALLYSQVIPLDLRLYGGAVQRLGALVMFVPMAVLCGWLLSADRAD
jgi:hypothetical protein